LLRFVFLSLGDAIASADEKKSKIDSKESILILSFFLYGAVYAQTISGKLELIVNQEIRL